MTTEKVPAKYRSLKMADASLGKCSIFVYSGGIAWTRHRLSVHRSKKKCVETFWNTGRVVGNPGKAVGGVCRSALKRTVMRFWREGTCSSKYKPENGTCWMRTVLAEWERYLQSFEIGWNESDLSYFSIPVWDTTRAYHLRNSVCTCDPWDVHNAIRTCSQATYFYNTPAWIVPEPTEYLSSQEAGTGLR